MFIYVLLSNILDLLVRAVGMFLFKTIVDAVKEIPLIYT